MPQKTSREYNQQQKNVQKQLEAQQASLRDVEKQMWITRERSKVRNRF